MRTQVHMVIMMKAIFGGLLILAFTSITQAGSKASVCRDNPSYMNQCRGFKDLGFCTNRKYKHLMYINCRRRCGMCRPLRPPVPTTIKCGKDKDVFANTGVLGVNAVAHRWEWQGGIYYYDEFVCGGTLISPNLFLTAAHCVHSMPDVTSMFIRLGDHNRYEHERGEQDIKVKEIITHKGWNPSTLANDIALIKLDKSVMVNEQVGIVCLPKANRNPPENSKCYVTGWGKTGIHLPMNILQEAEMTIIPNSVCEERSIVDEDGKSMIRSTNFCGGYQKSQEVSGCMGDSGGPCVCKEGNNWILQGVVSWNPNRCNTTDGYTLFTRVNKYIEWINDNSN